MDCGRGRRERNNGRICLKYDAKFFLFGNHVSIDSLEKLGRGIGIYCPSAQI
jgi:hypothetical protein